MSDMVFRPGWLDRIRTDGPSVLTANIITPDRLVGPEWLLVRSVSCSGTIVPRDDELARQARVVGARRARKEARAAEMGRGRLYDRMDRRAERQAAKEAKRIMNERRAACRAAFAKEEIDG